MGVRLITLPVKNWTPIVGSKRAVQAQGIRFVQFIVKKEEVSQAYSFL